MVKGEFYGIGIEAAERRLMARARDTRPLISTGWLDVDKKLHRGGFWPGTLVLLGGRTHTRKTSLTMNLVANMLRAGTSVGFVGLDESLENYTAKLLSAFSGLPAVDFEARPDDGDVVAAREEFNEMVNDRLSMTVGYRPDVLDLKVWMDNTEKLGRPRPQVVFFDYVSLLSREKYDGGENQRIARLIEHLQVWTNEMQVVTIGLHQVGRMDEGSNRRYHGDTPMSLESLKYGGEEIADVVFGTYRPALDPIGNMSMEEARADRVDPEDYEDRAARVERERDVTYFQLLKNRPGTNLDYRGVRLRSIGESMQMVPAADLGAGAVDERARPRPLEASGDLGRVLAAFATPEEKKTLGLDGTEHSQHWEG